MATRNLLVRAGFDASGMRRGTQQASGYLRTFGQQANQSVSGFSNMLSGMSKLLVSAFAVGSIVEFGRQCVNLGSELQEVQNVVDVTFQGMANDINNFADTALESFGLAEVSAKKYASTMGAMLKSSGVGLKDATEMSKTLAGLSADMASFYNLDNDTAFEKIMSGISGETEPLKKLGVNMSVANMEAYALSQGITKAWSSMSQMEQTMLRYNYLLSVTGDAQGDFARTSGSWSNQTRLLGEQFKELMTILGGVLTNVLLPIVQGLNAILKSLLDVIGGFNAMHSAITGKEVTITTGNISDATSDMEDFGDTTEEAMSKATKATLGFDEVNVLNTSGADTSGVGGSSGGISGGLNFETGTTESVENLAEVDKILKGIFGELTRIKDIFAVAFQLSLGDFDFDKIKKNANKLKEDITDILSGIRVNASKWFDSVANVSGSWLGSVSKIGLSLGDGILQGISDSIEKNKQWITDSINNTFENMSSANDSWSNIFRITGDSVGNVLSSESASQIWQGINDVLTATFIGAPEVFSTLWDSISEGAEYAAVTLAPELEQAFQSVVDVLGVLSVSIGETLVEKMGSLAKTCREEIGPALEGLIKTFTDLSETFLNKWNEYMAPVIEDLKKDITDAFDNHVKPAIDSVIDTVAKLTSGLDTLLEHWKPVIDFIIGIFVPILTNTLGVAINTVITIFKGFWDIVKAVWEVLGGLIDFVTGVFTGDWELAWKGVGEVFGGVWNGIQSVVETVGGIIDGVIDGIIKNIRLALETLTGLVDDAKAAFDYMTGNVQEHDGTSLEQYKKDTASYDWDRFTPEAGEEMIKLQTERFGYSEDINKYIRDMINGVNHYAKGGVINEPQMALIGEAGKEVVLPLENNTGWMDSLAIRVANAVNAGNTGNSSPTSIILEADMQQLAKAIVPFLGEASRRTGVVFNG